MGSPSEQEFIDHIPLIQVRYTNYRGETRIRKIIPLQFVYKKSYFHKGQPEEWIMECYDIEKGAMRDYALKDCDFTLSEHTSISEIADRMGLRD